MPSNRALRFMNSAHRCLLKLSGGRLGWTAADMPVLELTTIGRKSGKPRSVMLTSPHRDGDAIVIVASKGGADHHPNWFLNLRDNPRVVVTMQGSADRNMSARVASREERERLWPTITSDFTNYAGYQGKTEREIPLVMLEPAD